MINIERFLLIDKAEVKSLLLNKVERKNVLIIFTKFPVPGKAKTRLIPAIGSEKAADLHRRMTEETVKKAKTLSVPEGVELRIFYAGGNVELMRDWLGDLNFTRQKNGDLGEKMFAAFEKAFSDKAERVVVIGADCPDLSPSTIKEAFAALEKKDLVVGPAIDGGYYLIGLRKRAEFLFENISWGSEEVFFQTTKKAEKKGLKTAILKTLRDIDRPADLLLMA